MSEQIQKILIGILVAVAFIVCIALVVVGQRNVGLNGLGMELLGLAGLLFLLWLYNRKYK